MKGLARIFTITYFLLLYSPAYSQVAWEAPVFDDSEMRYARDLMQKGQNAKAVSFLLEVYAVRKSVDHKRTVELLSKALQNDKNYEILKEFADEYRKDFPDSLFGFLITSRVYFLTDRDEKARKTLTRALKKIADDRRDFSDIAREYMRNGIMQEAVDVYLIGRKKLKKPFEFAQELAGIYEALGRYSDAASEYLFLTIDQPNRLSYSKSRIKVLFENSDDPDKIISALKDVSGKYPLSKEKLLLLSDAYRHAGDYRKALDTYIDYDSMDEKKGRIIISFLNECLQDQQYDIAIKGALYIMDSYSDRLQTYWRSRLITAAAYKGKGRHQKAKEVYLEIIEKSPEINSKLDSYMHLGDMAFGDGKYNEAERYFGEIVRRFRQYPVTTSALIRLGDIQLYRANFDSAMSVYSNIKFKGKAPGEDDVKFKMARIELYRGNHRMAALNAMKYIFDYPSGSFANDCLVLIDIIKQAESDSSALHKFARADFYMLVSDFSSSESLFTEIYDSIDNPALKEAAYLNNIKIAVTTERYKEAAGMMHDFEKRYPDSYNVPFVLVELGELFSKQKKDHKKAESIFKDVLDRFPESLIIDRAREGLKNISPPDQI